jgi:hypothetical protein
VITAFSKPISASPGVQPDNAHCGFTTQGPEIHVVWEQSGAVKYMKSMDEGQNWTSPITIGGTTNELQLTKCIAVEGNYVHVIYSFDSRNGSAPPQLKYVRSVDGGTTWGSEVTLDDGSGKANDRFLRGSIVSRGGIVHVVYSDEDSSTHVGSPLYYRRSTDNGTTFAARTSLVTGSGTTRPEIDVAGSNGETVHIAWTDDRNGSSLNGGETYYKRSADSGVNWGSDVRLSNTTNKSCLRPTIAAEATGVVCVWQDQGAAGPDTLYRRYSTDDGVTWAASTQIVTSGGQPQEHPTVAYSGGVVVLVWSNRDITPDTTYTKKSVDGGNTWDTGIAVSAPGGDTAAPGVAFTTRFAVITDRQLVTDGYQLVRAVVRTADPAETLVDNFNRASLGANWTTPGVLNTNVGLETIGSVALVRAAAGSYRQGGYWNVAQYSDVDAVWELSQVGADVADGITMYVRLNSPGGGSVDGYGVTCTYNGTSWDTDIWEVLNAATASQYVGTITGLAAGDKLAITARGNLIIFWRKPAAGSWTPLAVYIDDTYTTGYVGVELLNDQDMRVTNLFLTEANPHRLYAVADSVDGSWTDQAGGTSLFAAIDEATPSDSDYIKSDADPTNSGCRVRLTSTGDPGLSVDHSILWRVGKAGTDRCDMTLKIYQGGGDSQGAGTLVATRTRSAVTAAFVTYQEDLRKSEIDAITDWAHLYAEFYADTP